MAEGLTAAAFGRTAACGMELHQVHGELPSVGGTPWCNRGATSLPVQ